MIDNKAGGVTYKKFSHNLSDIPSIGLAGRTRPGRQRRSVRRSRHQTPVHMLNTDHHADMWPPPLQSTSFNTYYG